MNLVNDDMVPIDEDPHLIYLEIYIACLAQLSEFTDCKGKFWCLREDEKQHPKLEQLLIDKLVELANSQHDYQVGLKGAAAKVLNNFKLSREGNPLESPPAVLGNVATFPRNASTSMSNDSGLNSQERGHSELYRLVDRGPDYAP